MAIRHGLAGQYGKNEAKRVNVRMAMLLVGSIIVGAAVLGFLYGYFFSIRAQGLLLPIFMLIGLPMLWLWRWLDRRIDIEGKKRIKHMRGGQAEGLVAWILEDLDDRWHVFNGVKLESGSDTDHIVVGPGGLFCISTKSHRGWFQATHDGVLRNGKPVLFAADVKRQAMNLVSRLKAAMGNDVPWVQPVLATPFGYTEGDPFNGKVWLVHADDLIERIAPEKADSRSPKPLTAEQVRRVVGLLEMIQTGAAEIYQRPAPIE